MKKDKMDEQVTIAAEAPKDDFEAKNAADTLMQAEEIKSNKELMKRVHKHLHKKKKAISSISDLRKIADEKYGSGEGQAD